MLYAKEDKSQKAKDEEKLEAIKRRNAKLLKEYELEINIINDTAEEGAEVRWKEADFSRKESG
jgi:hypothetical protein